MKILKINNHQSFKSNKLHPKDLAYKKTLQQGLKESFNLDCKIENLNSIAGPMELRDIISKLKPFHYERGENFRANFHIHTVASDGSLTVEKFLEQCKKWADYIFKLGKSNDGLPPFCAAITDHDRIKSVRETIAEIAQKPEEYKNFKFVAGCEFLFHGYKEPHTAFEAVGLGFNPFDKDLEPMMKGFGSNNHVKDIPKITKSGGVLSWAHPIITPDKINDDFFTFLKSNGVNGIEGNYQYLKWDEEFVKKGKKLLEPFIEKYKMFCTGGTDSHRKTIFCR